MERLTEKITNKETGEILAYRLKSASAVDHIKACRKLGELEDAEEQGRLFVLPCKVGDTVWCIMDVQTRCTENDQEFDEYLCQGCECLKCDSKKIKRIYAQSAHNLQWILTNTKRFGVNIFLTPEEAEAALERMKGERNE